MGVNRTLVVSSKNPRIDLRNYKYKDILEVDAVKSKGAVIYGGKNFVKLKGSKTGADELWAGTGGAKMYGNGGKGTDIYHGSSGYDNFYHGIVEGNWTAIKSNEIVYGYTSGKDEIVYRGKFLNGKVSGRDVILNFSNGTMRIKNGVGKAIDLYPEENGSDIIRTFGTPILAKGLSYQNNRRKLVAKAPFKGDIKWAAYDSTVTEIDARAVNAKVNIEGNAGSEIIRAGQGGGTLWGGRGNDKLYGGKGRDVFLFHKKYEDDEEDGHDTIYNYESGRDIIRIERDRYTMRADGNDVIIKVGGPQYTWKNNKRVSLGVDSLRIVNGVGKDIIIQDAKGKNAARKVYRNTPSYAPYNSKKAMVTFNSKTPATAFDARSYTPDIRVLDGRAAGKKLNLTGNNANNTIYAGKAGGILSGLGGNDTLYGNSGIDTFRYTSGADTIVNYQSGRDIIQLASGKVTDQKVRGNDVILNIGKGSITIKSGLNKKLLVKDSKGQTHNYIYKAAAKKNSVSYLTKVQGVGSTKDNSMMHMTSKTNNSLSNITLSGNGQSESLNAKKSI